MEEIVYPQNDGTLVELPHEKLKKHLDEHGISYTWFSLRMGKKEAWCSGIVNGFTNFTEDNIKLAEEILKLAPGYLGTKN